MQTQMFINGSWENAISEETFPTINPATGEIIAQIPAGDDRDIDKAVKCARIAYDQIWSKTNPSDRGRLLCKLADLIDLHQDEISWLDCIDAGKPIEDCRADVSAAVSIVRYFAGISDKVYGHTIPAQQGFTTFTQREPYGVIGAITPWNYPFFLACGKVAPILAMGNTCVLKPAEQTPLSALALGKLAQEAGFPAGVLNIVTGLGERAGSALARHMDVDKISFTGSTEVGRFIMEASAKSNLKPVSLELGGKSPNIIFADAFLENALDAAVFIAFYNQGQTCTATTRLIVQDSIAGQVLDGLIARAKKIRVGDPLSNETHLGAIISKEQYKKIQNYIRIGLDEGAKLAFGGKQPSESNLRKGFFMIPTIFTDVRSDMLIAQEEIFGPVLTILKFTTEDEAVRLANDVFYGLAAAVWTQDASRLLRVTNAIKSGVVWGNCVFVGNPAVPVGGYKQSGFGKEYGLEAGLEYTRQKTVWINSTDAIYKWLS